MRLTYFRLFIWSTILASMPAAAQQSAMDPVGKPAVIDQLFDCREIDEPSERLACFDREVGRVYEAEVAREIVITGREEIEKTKRGLFGFNLPKIRLFGNEAKESDELETLNSTLSQARRLGSGRYIFTLEDGARWMQTDDVPVFGKPGDGDSIEIRKAALGSFKAKINGRRAIRIKRVN